MTPKAEAIRNQALSRQTAMREMRKSGATYAQIGAKFNVSACRANQIINRDYGHGALSGRTYNSIKIALGIDGDLRDEHIVAASKMDIGKMYNVGKKTVSEIRSLATAIENGDIIFVDRVFQ